MDELKRLEREGLKIEIPTDENGYTGRECPNCEKYFKIMFETRLPFGVPCHCPYCGHIQDYNQFFTKEQIEFEESSAEHHMMKALLKDLKKHDFTEKNEFFEMTSKTVGTPPPISQVHDKELETYVECKNCTLKYAVYGAFAFCPACGVHNSYQMLEKNFEIVDKIAVLVKSQDTSLADEAIRNSLKEVVAHFDGFGRNACLCFSAYSKDSEKVKRLSFQNIEGAKKKMIDLFGIDISFFISDGDWRKLGRLFQKRHILTHKSGIVDQDYIDKTGDNSVEEGRKIPVSESEVEFAMEALRRIGKGVWSRFENLKNTTEGLEPEDNSSASVPSISTDDDNSEHSDEPDAKKSYLPGLMEESSVVGEYLLKVADDKEGLEPMVDPRQIQENTGLSVQEIEDAISELIDHGFAKGDYDYVEATYSLAKEFGSGFLGYDPESDILSVTRVIVEQEKVKGEMLAEMTGLSPLRINRAAGYLEDNDYVKAQNHMGTAPFSFGELWANYRTRKLVKGTG